MKEGQLYVLSGPSGAGKGTMVKEITSFFPEMKFSISVTTRPPRPGEVDGVHYFFVSRDEFKRKIGAGEFLEWAEVYGNYYGTPKSFVRSLLSEGHDVLLDIDAQGALQMQKVFPKGVYIFLMAPSPEELRARLLKRRSDSQETIEKRLREAAEQVRFIDRYDYVVVNDRIESAVDRIVAIIKAEKCRSHRVDPELLRPYGVNIEEE